MAVAVSDIFAARTVAALAAALSARESRLEKVAEMYLAGAQMDAAEVASTLETGAAQ